MSGGHYPSIDQSRSAQEVITPRHRLPSIAPPRAPLFVNNSTFSVTNAQTSHTSRMNKHNTSSNYHKNSGFYGHTTVTRDYSSISRAHCNDESSAWSNPHFSNPLGDPPFRGALVKDQTTSTKGEIQRESMDLSSSHYLSFGTPAAVRLLAVNGDTASQYQLRGGPAAVPAPRIPSSVSADLKKEAGASSISSSNSGSGPVVITLCSSAANRRSELPASTMQRAEANVRNLAATVNDVEFALESMFHSDNRSAVSTSSTPAILSTPLCHNPKEMCVESVEKILKTPSPEREEDDDDDDNDDLIILDDDSDSSSAKSVVIRANTKLSSVERLSASGVAKSDASEKPTTTPTATKVVILKKKNCDCTVKLAAAKPRETMTFSKNGKPQTSKVELLNAAAKSQENPTAMNYICDTKERIAVDQISPEQASLSSKMAANAAVAAAIAVRTDSGRLDRKGADKTRPGDDSSKSLSKNMATNKTKLTPNSSGNADSGCGPNVGDHEITYVQVENELEKMFAGIEDSTMNGGSDKDPLSLTPTSAAAAAAPTKHDLSALSSSFDSQNSSSIATNLSVVPPSQSNAGGNNLFDRSVTVAIPAKTSKKKMSKTAVRSSTMAGGLLVKDSKQKFSNFACKESSSSISSLLDGAPMKRVPVIHVEGSKENPISAHIINSIKSEEDDVSEGRTSFKRKLGKSDRAIKKTASNFAFKNYDPGTSDATWVCGFCNLCAHAPGLAGEATGDLFGPYFIRTAEQIDLDKSKLYSWKVNHLELVKKKKLKKQKRSLSIERGYVDLSPADEHKSLEVWAHENCIVWASGVHLIGSKLIGLEDAVMQALETICAHCSNKGASIGCRARHCNSCAHYSCALYTGWKLNTETFISTCGVHSVPSQ